MGRDERREIRQRAVVCLKKAKAYVLVVERYDGQLVFYDDLATCGDQTDVRNMFLAMIGRQVRSGVQGIRRIAEAVLDRVEQEEAVAEVKAKRSEILEAAAKAVEAEVGAVT